MKRPSNQTLGILLIGAGLIVVTWFLAQNTGKMKSKANVAIGMALGQQQASVQGKVGRDAGRSMREAASPAPPHSPAIRSSTGQTQAQAAQINRASDTFSKVGAKQRSRAAISDTAKGSVQPPAELQRNMPKNQSKGMVTARPKTTEAQVRGLQRAPRTIRSGEIGRTQRADRATSPLGSSRNMRRRFY